MEDSDFQALVKVLERLLGPDGCPWDRQQTLKSIRSSLIEESYEVVEAIDLDDNDQIEEELGDLFFNVIFLCKMAEKENRCTMSSVLKRITEKLIRRHPHVYGDAEIKSMEGFYAQWDKIKSKEKPERTSALDGIPKGLPALARAQKALKKMKKSPYKIEYINDPAFETENELGAYLTYIVSQAAEKGLDAEHALREFMAKTESQFRSQEENC